MPAPHKLGTLTPVVYFRCPLGHVILAPYSDCPTPAHCEFTSPVNGIRCASPCEREYADTLAAISKLERALTAQENLKFAAERQFDEAQCEAGRQAVRDRLMQKLWSSHTPESEKDFIREWIKLTDEKRAKHYSKFEQYSVYINAAHYDLGNRRADEERNP